MWLAGSIIVATWPLSGLGIKPCFRFPKAGLVLPYSRDGCGPVFQMKRRCGLTRSSQASTLRVACPPSVRLGRVKFRGASIASVPFAAFSQIEFWETRPRPPACRELVRGPGCVLITSCLFAYGPRSSASGKGLFCQPALTMVV